MNPSRQMYLVCSEVVSVILQLRASPRLPAYDVLQRRVMGLFERMMADGREARLADQDMMEAKFALAAFADEAVFYSSWEGRAAWIQTPLQLQFFQTNNAGVEFYERLHALWVQPDRGPAVQMYLVCLALGFHGLHARDPEALALEIRGAGAYASYAAGGRGDLAPNAARPDGAGLGSEIRRSLSAMQIAIGILALTMLVIIVLFGVISAEAASAAEEIRTDTSGR